MANVGMADERGNPRRLLGPYLQGRRAPVRSRVPGSRRASWGGWARTDGLRRPRRAALTFSLAASSCLLDAMADMFPGSRFGKPPSRRVDASSTRAPGITPVMPPVARGFQFKLTAEADNVPVLRRALHALLVPAGVDPDRVASIALAATEVCANVVRHAYPDGERGVIRVEAALVPDGLVTIVVRDHGVGIARSTEVRMTFAASAEHAIPARDRPG